MHRRLCVGDIVCACTYACSCVWEHLCVSANKSICVHTSTFASKANKQICKEYLLKFSFYTFYFFKK